MVGGGRGLAAGAQFAVELSLERRLQIFGGSCPRFVDVARAEFLSYASTL